MTTNGIPPAPDPQFSAGFDAGLQSARSLESHDLEVVSFARALSALGKHAAMMDNRDEEYHDSCMECGAMILLARVVGFGNQLRAVERRAQRK